jgi:hypothetical protein
VLNSPLVNEKKSYPGTWSFNELSEKKSTASTQKLPFVDMDDPTLILFTVIKFNYISKNIIFFRMKII